MSEQLECELSNQTEILEHIGENQYTEDPELSEDIKAWSIVTKQNSQKMQDRVHVRFKALNLNGFVKY